MKITNEFEYTPTLKELAQEIWNLSDEDQAKLLGLLYNIDTVYRVEMQLEYLSDRLKEDNNKSGFELIRSLNSRLETDR